MSLSLSLSSGDVIMKVVEEDRHVQIGDRKKMGRAEIRWEKGQGEVPPTDLGTRTTKRQN